MVPESLKILTLLLGTLLGMFVSHIVKKKRFKRDRGVFACRYCEMDRVVTRIFNIANKEILVWIYNYKGKTY